MVSQPKDTIPTTKTATTAIVANRPTRIHATAAVMATMRMAMRHEDVGHEAMRMAMTAVMSAAGRLDLFDQVGADCSEEWARAGGQI